MTNDSAYSLRGSELKVSPGETSPGLYVSRILAES